MESIDHFGSVVSNTKNCLRGTKLGLYTNNPSMKYLEIINVGRSYLIHLSNNYWVLTDFGYSITFYEYKELYKNSIQCFVKVEEAEELTSKYTQLDKYPIELVSDIALSTRRKIEDHTEHFNYEELYSLRISINQAIDEVRDIESEAICLFKNIEAYRHQLRRGLVY